MTAADALTQIKQLCSLGLGSHAVMPAALAALRRLVPSVSAAIFWIDGDGELADLYAERMLPPETTRHYFATYYAHPQVGFRALVRRLTSAAAGIDEEDVAAVEPPERRQSMYALGAHHVVRALVADGAQPLAYLSLYRDGRQGALRAIERERLGLALRHIVIAHRARGDAAPAAASEFVGGGHSCLALVAADGTVLQASPRGHALIAQASDCPINPATMRGELEARSRTLLLPLVLAARAQGPAAAPDPCPPQRVLQSTWGLSRLRAYPVGAHCGVLIEREDHADVRWVTAMAPWGLTPRQRAVALLLARGADNRAIAAALRVSANTAAYHVKQVFRQLDIGERRQVAERLDHPPA